MDTVKQSRNEAIDILRTLGTLLVILAHVHAPDSLQVLRSFDVCLLVMISGYCCSVQLNRESYLSYAIKRVKRLAVPSWITMTLIITLAGMLCLVARRDYLYTIKQIVETYLFLGGQEGGVGLFWIVRIYLLMSLVAPVLSWLNKRINNLSFFIITASAVLVANEILYLGLWGKFSVMDFILENFVMSLLAYGVVYLVGMRLKTNKSEVFTLCLLSGVAVVLTQIPIHFHNENYIIAAYKYPPQLAYVSYGLFGSMILFVFVDSMVRITKGRTPRWMIWFSQNSFNIYLAHAVVLKLLSWGDRFINKISILEKWYVVYFCVVFSSCFGVWVMGKILPRK